MIRVLYLNAKSDDPDKVAAETVAVGLRLGTDAVTTSGLADFMARSRADGGWNPWVRRAAARYDLFVLPAETCGRATYEIANGALAAGRRVILLPVTNGPDGIILGAAKVVRRVLPAAGGDFKAGYAVDTGPG